MKAARAVSFGPDTLETAPDEEPQDLVTDVSPDYFKAEVASIVKELGNRLDNLLEQHEACVLRASNNRDQHVPLRECARTHSGSMMLRPDQVPPQPPETEPPQMLVSGALATLSEALPTAGTMGSLSASLPGCPDAPPAHPDMLRQMSLETPGIASSSGCTSYKLVPDSVSPNLYAATTNLSSNTQNSLDQSMKKSIVVRKSFKVSARTVWMESSSTQKEAVARCEASVEFESVHVDKVPKILKVKTGNVFHAHIPQTKVDSISSRRSNLKFKPWFEPSCDIMHPVGRTRTCWNIVCLILICQDALTVPLLVFGIGDSSIWQAFAWLCTFFWTMDMFMAFRTGYFIGVKVEMRPVQVAKQYARTWLAFDLFIVVFEWFSRFFSSLAPPEVARTTRIVRGVRLLKLLRIAKMKGLVSEFAERLNSNTLVLILHLVLLTTLLCVVCHFVACAWYALGDSASDGWITYDLYAVGTGLDQVGTEFWYLSSARWVISQINGRTDMDERRNMPERGFAVVAGVILAVVGRSLFVASITKMMLQLGDLYKKKEERKRCVNDYLSLYQLPAAIERSVKGAVHEYKDIDVERHREGIVLGLLPRKLKSELLYEVRKPLLENHPLFRIIMYEFKTVAHHLCLEVILQLHAASQDPIFKSGDPCSRMLLMEAGSMWYAQSKEECGSEALDKFYIGRETVALQGTQKDLQSEKVAGLHSLEGLLDGAAIATRVTYGMRVSEPALWATWSTKGSLMTDRNCRMLEVDATVLGVAMQGYPDVFGLTVVYSRYFLQILAEQHHLSDVLSFDVRSVASS